MSVAAVPEVNQRLKVPSCRRSKLYREIMRRLMSDTTLKRVVKTWRVWDGTAVSDDELAASMCPFVRATPHGGGGQNRDNISQRGVVRVELEIATAGLNAEDCMDLWDCVENVVFPSVQADEADIRTALREMGADGTPVKITEPAAFAPDIEGGLMRAVGAFTVTYRIQG